jgi:hypothetical protein
MSTYPALEWDSLATVAHSNAQDFAINSLDAIPCASFVDVDTTEIEVVYTYKSRLKAAATDGRPVAWRYFGDDYAYVYFDLPLSFFGRADATEALQQALDELLDGEPEPHEDPVDPPEHVPDRYTLSQNYPNPFNAGTTIEYRIPQKAHVRIDIFNTLGQRVVTLVDAVQPANTYTVTWDGADASGRKLASGAYLYRLRSGGHEETRKLMLLK